MQAPVHSLALPSSWISTLAKLNHAGWCELRPDRGKWRADRLVRDRPLNQPTKTKASLQSSSSQVRCSQFRRRIKKVREQMNARGPASPCYPECDVDLDGRVLGYRGFDFDRTSSLVRAVRSAVGGTYNVQVVVVDVDNFDLFQVFQRMRYWPTFSLRLGVVHGALIVCVV